jgi:hypothetical protein
VGLDQQAFKIGDILRFKADGTIVYGIYLNHYFRTTEYGDGHCGDGYNVFNVIAFDTGNPNEYYDWEYEDNLTKQREEDER